MYFIIFFSKTITWLSILLHKCLLYENFYFLIICFRRLMNEWIMKRIWVWRQKLKLTLKSFAMRMMPNQIMMVRGEFVHLNIWCCIDLMLLFWYIAWLYFFPIKHGSLYPAIFMFFLCLCRRNGIRLWWNWCERRASVSFIGMWPGLFCVFYDLMFIVDLIFLIYL